MAVLFLFSVSIYFLGWWEKFQKLLWCHRYAWNWHIWVIYSLGSFRSCFNGAGMSTILKKNHNYNNWFCFVSLKTETVCFHYSCFNKILLISKMLQLMHYGRGYMQIECTEKYSNFGLFLAITIISKDIIQMQIIKVARRSPKNLSTTMHHLRDQ